MQLENVGQALGTRELDISDGRKVSIVIGVPQQDDGDYFCPYQITGIGDVRIGYAMGIDALQALQLTLKKIGTELYTSDEAQTGMLSWEGENARGDLGFPVPDVLKDLLPK